MPREMPEGLHVENEPNNIWDSSGRLVARVNWGMEITDDAMSTRRVSQLFAASPDLLDACARISAAQKYYDEHLIYPEEVISFMGFAPWAVAVVDAAISKTKVADQC